MFRDFHQFNNYIEMGIGSLGNQVKGQIIVQNHSSIGVDVYEYKLSISNAVSHNRKLTIKSNISSSV